MSTPPASVWRAATDGGSPGTGSRGVLVTGGVCIVAIGLAAAWSPTAGLLLVALTLLTSGVLVRPAWAAYLLLAVTPLVAGMDRGAVLPLLRPHEALALLLGAILFGRGVVRVARGGAWRPEIRPLDVALVGLAVASSVLPLCWLVVRGLDVTADDLQHALTLWKYFAGYVLVRSSVSSETEVARCLWVALGSAAVVALVAVLQSLQLFGVPELLATHFAPFGNERAVDNARGTSTLASSIAVADLMAYSLAIALGWWFRRHERRGPVVALSVVFAVGALGSGQFSGAIALVLAVTVVGWVSGQTRRALAMVVPSAAVGSLLLWPVIERRMSGFSSPEGLPHSWTGRLDNLRTYFWPELFSDFDFLLGVRPSARIAATETWRDWIWIESGHTWLLWAGGIPLFVAFVLFVFVALRDLYPVARYRRDAIGVAAVAAFTAMCVMSTLMLFDQHLTLRGSADLLFPLLALALTSAAPSRLPTTFTSPDSGRGGRQGDAVDTA